MAENVLKNLIKMEFPPEELDTYRIDLAAELQRTSNKTGSWALRIPDLSAFGLG